MTDLFDWADAQRSEAASATKPKRARTLIARPTARLYAFPITRHRSMIEKLARRYASYDDKRARFFLRREIDKMTERRVSKGIPRAIAEQGASELERAIWHRIVILDQHGGDAA